MVLSIITHLFSLALSLGIVLYTWQHRQVRGARVYAWFVGGQSLTNLGFIVELVSPTLESKLLWHKFQWLTDSFLVILPFLVFSVQFSEHTLRYLRFTWGTVLAIVIVFTALLLTDNIHHLIYPNPYLSADDPFPELRYELTPPVYIYALVYVYGANLYGISLLFRRALRPYIDCGAVVTAGCVYPVAGVPGAQPANSMATIKSRARLCLELKCGAVILHLQR
jgi:hypothetical protein